MATRAGTARSLVFFIVGPSVIVAYEWCRHAVLLGRTAGTPVSQQTLIRFALGAPQLNVVPQGPCFQS
jgi:hypothetical protein